MFDPEFIKQVATAREKWEQGELRDFVDRQPEIRSDCTTGSGLPVQRIYTPEDIAGALFEDIGFPGQYPFTRGPYPTMYAAGRGRCARSPDTEPAKTLITGFITSLHRGRPDCRSTSTCRP